MKRASPTGSPKTGSPTRETKLLPTYSSDDDGDDIKIKKKRVTKVTFQQALLMSLICIGSGFLLLFFSNHNFTDKSTPDTVSSQKEPDRFLGGEASAGVVEAFVDTWSAYQQFAYGEDVLHALSRRGARFQSFNLGLMIVDSLDTILIMGLHSQAAEALDWIDNNLESKMDNSGSVSLFECTIRVLGGLIGAATMLKTEYYENIQTYKYNVVSYSSSPEYETLSVHDRTYYTEKLLFLAEKIGRKLIRAFDGNVLPSPDVDLRTGSLD